MRTARCLHALLVLAAGCGKTGSVAFLPTANVTIAGGNHSYTSFTLPAGITATVAADAVLRVAGDISIAGNLVGDCVGIDLEGAKAVEILGKISNVCSGAGAKDLIIHTVGGAKLTVGAAGAPATLDTSGNLDITNDPTLLAADFLLPPALRSATPLAPACAATADSVLTVATAGSPAPVSFRGTGVAPSGGGLTWKWDFGDGASAATQDSAHSYAAGRYEVVLTVTGDDKQTCASKLKLVVIDGSAAPGTVDPGGPPGLSIGGSRIVASVGEAISLDANAATAVPATLTTAWDFGDGAQASTPFVQHAFAQPGRYAITATVAADGQSSTATVSVYVHPAPKPAARPRAQETAASCAQPNFNAAVNNAPRPIGERVEFTTRGDVVIGAQTNVSVQDGAAGASAVGGIVARGEDGRPGADMRIWVSGNLTVCDGAQIRGGSGGDGGSATATHTAYAGVGGLSGGIDIKAGYGGAANIGAGATVIIGKGGRGGDATATATDQAPGCTAGSGGQVKPGVSAWGGKGGNIGEWAWSYDLPDGFKISGGPAGKAGNATAQGGAGEDQIACGSNPLGKRGDDAFAKSSYGGSLRVSPAIAAALRPGGGGTASATSGRGGTATAELPPACSPAHAAGGPGGKAIAESLGPGHSPVPVTGLTPCSATAIGGRGGNGAATGAGCGLCWGGPEYLGNGFADGGPGGDAETRLPDDPLKSTGSEARGGKGGSATAAGGDGGSCTTCPAGRGQDGARATSTGGQGGLASGTPAKLIQGLGGAAAAAGGHGGTGASCCSPPPTAGGNGGNGGGATAIAGSPSGVDSGRGGSGGPGGDGFGFGAGGDRGAGVGIPTPIAEGSDGVLGNNCVTETACGSVGKTCAFTCGHNVTGNCSCGTATQCQLGDPTPPQTGGIYLGPTYFYATFTQDTPAPFRARFAAASQTFGNTIYGAAGQCVLWTYSGAFPSTTPLDLGTVTATSGIKTVTAVKQSNGTYSKFDSSIWTGPGLSVTLAASGSGANAPISVTGTTFDAFTLTAPTIAPPSKVMIPTASDLTFTFTGTPNGSGLQVALFFDANTATTGQEVLCRGQGGSLVIPKELLQILPAASTGTLQLYQLAFLPVSGSGFRWANSIYRTPLNPSGQVIANSLFQLTP